MKFLLILFFSLNACASSGKRPVEVPLPTPVVSPSPIMEDHRGYAFKCLNCTTKESVNIKNAQVLLGTTIQGTCFADHFIDPKFRSKLIQTEGLSRSDVVNKIKNSSIVDIPIKFYTPTLFQSKKVVGYTYPGDPTIYLNRSFRRYTSWTTASEASNLIHEVTHKLGFTHDFKATADRPYSVPYTANFAMDSCT